MRGTSRGRRTTTLATLAVALLAVATTALVAPAHADDAEGPGAALSLNPASGVVPLPVTLRVDEVEGRAVATGGVVAWSDGSPDSVITADGPGGALQATHTYEFGGWYPVLVRVHDASGTWSPWLEAGAVEVDGPSRPPEDPVPLPCPGPDCGWPYPNDRTAPSVAIDRPAKAKRARAAAWRTVRGAVSDGGAGVASTTAAVVVRTSVGWSHLDGGRWRTAPTKARALARTSRLIDASVSSGRWSVRLRPAPPRGVIHVRAWAVDRAANASAPVALKQKLTR